MNLKSSYIVPQRLHLQNLLFFKWTSSLTKSKWTTSKTIWTPQIRESRNNFRANVHLKIVYEKVYSHFHI